MCKKSSCKYSDSDSSQLISVNILFSESDKHYKKPKKPKNHKNHKNHENHENHKHYVNHNHCCKKYYYMPLPINEQCPCSIQPVNKWFTPGNVQKICNDDEYYRN